MGNRSANLGVTLLLLVACVHQLGAAPCGCLDHNGWYQALVSDSGSHDGHHESDGHAAFCECECDHVPSQAAILETRLASGPEVNSLVKSGPCPTVAASETLRQGPRSWRYRNAGGVSAQTLRAQLQVFCL